ncbi:MAG TPA: hypothetical protein VFF74_04390 [Methylophilaceae bacterium]|nr:hypothetical protein [Methylophilaceae bacterium]
MSAVSVKKVNDSTFEVAVEGASVTTHVVTVPLDYASKLTEDRVPVETLIVLSFEFLLERESNTSILRRFELPVIANYFPEYETTMRGMLLNC